jgi:hypothetical protein
LFGQRTSDHQIRHDDVQKQQRCRIPGPLFMVRCAGFFALATNGQHSSGASFGTLAERPELLARNAWQGPSMRRLKRNEIEIAMDRRWTRRRWLRCRSVGSAEAACKPTMAKRSEAKSDVYAKRW